LNDVVGDGGPDDCDEGRDEQSVMSRTSIVICTGGSSLLLLNRGFGASLAEVFGTAKLGFRCGNRWFGLRTGSGGVEDLSVPSILTDKQSLARP
jgi:hypothetical protein